MLPRARAAAAVLLALPVPVLAGSAAGCGNEPTTPPNVTAPRAPSGWKAIRAGEPRVTVSVPRNWPAQIGPEPSVVSVGSGRALVAVWRYPRSEPAPRTADELRDARRALVEAVRRRDTTFSERSVTTSKVGGVPAIVVLGEGTIRDTRVRIRSTHVYHEGTELVVDAYAPPEVFDRLDQGTFRRIAASLRLAPPRE